MAYGGATLEAATQAVVQQSLPAIGGTGGLIAVDRHGNLSLAFNTEGMLVNAIGYVAEAAYHHPDLSVTWARVGVKLKTHSAGGITDKDFALARQIEEIVLWRPAAGGALAGTPNKFVRSGERR